jgi:hypothetical protein
VHTACNIKKEQIEIHLIIKQENNGKYTIYKKNSYGSTKLLPNEVVKTSNRNYDASKTDIHGLEGIKD